MMYRKIKLFTAFIVIFTIPLIAFQQEQTARLAELAKIWGVLKYFHPQVAEGEIDWDLALFSVIPDIKAASSLEAYNAGIDKLIDKAGIIRLIGFQAGYPENESLAAINHWINKSPFLDWYNRLRLKAILVPLASKKNYYVRAYPGVGNTLYDNEKTYYNLTYHDDYPNEQKRLLALFRYWNIINFFYPYKDIIGENWDNILTEFIPRLINAQDEIEYHLLVREFTARINDSHSGFISSVYEDYLGKYYPPFQCRHIQGETVITEVYEGLLTNPGEIMEGDIIVKLNGKDIKTLRQNLKKYMRASNDVSTEWKINDYLFMDEKKPFELDTKRYNQETKVTLNRFSVDEINSQPENLPKEQWTILPGNIGYVNMGELDKSEAEQVVTKLKNTKAIIFDIRNYPQGTLYTICEDLFPEAVPFVNFTIPDLMNPGTFYWTGASLTAGPKEYNADYYKGKVVLLFDERTISHAEFTCMALQKAPDVTMIGSQTAGADGNVSNVVLPGGIQVYFTGIGVFYPDGTPTQRIGIVPDIVVKPTIEGIRQGRDEVLEAAIDYINWRPSRVSNIPNQENYNN